MSASDLMEQGAMASVDMVLTSSPGIFQFQHQKIDFLY